MTQAQIIELREDITQRHLANPRRATDLELRMYQQMMKKVNAADPYIK